MYNAHPFCREGVKEPGATNKDTYFFHISSRESAEETEEEKELVEKYNAAPVTEALLQWE